MSALDLTSSYKDVDTIFETRNKKLNFKPGSARHRLIELTLTSQRKAVLTFVKSRSEWVLIQIQVFQRRFLKWQLIAIFVIGGFFRLLFDGGNVPQDFPTNTNNETIVCTAAYMFKEDIPVELVELRGGVLPGANGFPITPSKPMSPHGQPRVNRRLFSSPTSPQHVPGTKISSYNPNGTLRNGGPAKSLPPSCSGQQGRLGTGLSTSKKYDENQSNNKYKVYKEMSSTLSKISKKVRKDEDARKGLDKLAKQLGNGELHAGRGAKKLPGTETVFYMRSGGEARLFFKYADKDKGVVHVIAESDKDNETKVMDNIKKNYE